MRPSVNKKSHVLILGSGFAAWQLVQKLDRHAYRVTVVSPRKHFLFTPLLTQVATGAVASRNVLEPLRGQKNAPSFLHAICEEIHPDRKSVLCRSPFDQTQFSVDYDKLVVAVGAQNRTFDIPGVRKHAHFLKEVQDADSIRSRLLDCLERASLPETSEADRRRLLQWVVVGGGPTGAECAADLEDLKRDMHKVYPEVSEQIKVTLLEATEDILPAFDKALREYAERHFRREEIEVRTNVSASEVRENEIILTSGDRIPCGLVVWSTGIEPRPLIRNVDLPKEDRGFLLTNAYCGVEEYEGVYALGDTAVIRENPLPATAQVAQQQGTYLASQLNRLSKGKSINPFQFKSKGMLAKIGGGHALGELPTGHVKGRAAWWLWRSVYLTKLVGWANKVRLFLDWLPTGHGGHSPNRFS